MKISIKVPQGGEFAFEVLPTTLISEIKQQIAERLNISIHQQELLFLGTALTDTQTVQSYPDIKDGTQLNLDAKKIEGLFEASVKYFKEGGMSEEEAINSANRLLMTVEEKFNRLTWYDIEWLSHDCLLEECGHSSPPEVEDEPVSQDVIGL